MEDILRSIGEAFSDELYIWSTRILSSLWTYADLVIIFFLTKTCNVLRQYLGSKIHRIPYVILALTVPPALLLPFVNSGWDFLKLEIAITFPHFFLLLYLFLGNVDTVITAFHRKWSQEENVAKGQN